MCNDILLVARLSVLSVIIPLGFTFAIYSIFIVDQSQFYADNFKFVFPHCVYSEIFNTSAFDSIFQIGGLFIARNITAPYPYISIYNTSCKADSFGCLLCDYTPLPIFGLALILVGLIVLYFLYSVLRYVSVAVDRSEYTQL